MIFYNTGHISSNGVFFSPEGYKKVLGYLWGKRAGGITSDAKKRAARENGKLGGRPPGSKNKKGAISG